MLYGLASMVACILSFTYRRAYSCILLKIHGEEYAIALSSVYQRQNATHILSLVERNVYPSSFRWKTCNTKSATKCSQFHADDRLSIVIMAREQVSENVWENSLLQGTNMQARLIFSWMSILDITLCFCQLLLRIMCEVT